MFNSSRVINLFSLLFLLLVIAINIWAINSPGTEDVSSWKRWTRRAVEQGAVVGYCETPVNYPPGSFVIWSIFGAAFKPFTAVKLSIFTFWHLYLCLVLFLSHRAGLPLWAGALLASNPAIMVNAQFLGYLDIYFAPFLMLSFYLLKKQGLLFWSGFSFALAVLLKWQPIVILPFFLIFLWRFYYPSISSRRAFMTWGAGFVVLILLIGGIYAVLGGGDCLVAALNRILETRFRLVSGNALNLNWIVTYFLHLFRPDLFGPLKEGMIKVIKADLPLLQLFNTALVALGNIFSLGLLARSSRTHSDFALAALAGMFIYFLFGYNVHENHGFPLLIIATFLVLLSAKEIYHWCLWGVVSLFHLANLLMFYGLTGEREVSRVVMGLDITIVFSVLYIVFFAFFAWETIRGIGRKPLHEEEHVLSRG